ncbi:hypothetical protein OUZ56_031067 [Daphnia magna]|uniref:Uncharacterized protein n=1 Tax=Daphnia magna TaxID=35525 RepID=A0ABQ9ZTA9_9CRUS|nr:hypothetical protein OUZ56_031067 [Daphnia magna]
MNFMFLNSPVKIETVHEWPTRLQFSAKFVRIEKWAKREHKTITKGSLYSADIAGPNFALIVNLGWILGIDDTQSLPFRDDSAAFNGFLFLRRHQIHLSIGAVARARVLRHQSTYSKAALKSIRLLFPSKKNAKMFNRNDRSCPVTRIEGGPQFR